jgi:hypothetical protein
MTSIDAVTITAQFSLYSRGGPDPDSPANLHTNPGSAYVGRWQAGILSLNLPAGGKSEVACRDVTEAIRAATLVWDTPAGQGAIEHRQAEREAEQQRYKAAVARAIWTGERRHEWQEPKQLVALAKAAIQQAVKDGVLPMPNDYRVTWRSDDEAIYDTAGEIVLGVYTIDKASLLNCDRLVLAIGVCVSQASTRTMLMARAVKTCCRLVLTRPA